MLWNHPLAGTLEGQGITLVHSLESTGKEVLIGRGKGKHPGADGQTRVMMVRYPCHASCLEFHCSDIISWTPSGLCFAVVPGPPVFPPP